MDIKDVLSTLDTERFGFKVAKFNDFSLKPQEVLSWLKENDVRLVLSKVDSKNMKLINTLERLKFFIKDIQVTYKYDLKDHVTDIKGEQDLIIRNASRVDIPELKKIGLESFREYGHYFEDERLDRSKCNEIYADWIKRSMEDVNVADKVFVAEYKGEIAGFLSFKKHRSDNCEYAAGGIGAVARKYRGRNIFKMITIAGLNWGREEALEWEEHNVLITNYAVNRSFSMLGFKIYRSFVTMHHWIE